MKVVFSIHYRVSENQKLHVIGSIPELGNWQVDKAGEMEHDENGNRKLTIETTAKKISYRYIIVENENVINEAWTQDHTIKLDSSFPVHYLYDYWQLVPDEVALYSSAFTKNRFAHHHTTCSSPKSDRQLIISVLCPRIEKDQRLFIAGNGDTLGNWNPCYAKEMCCVDFPEWEIRLNMEEIAFPFEYKFFIANEKRTSCLWEKGENRLLSNLHEDKNAVCVVSDYPYRDSRPMWKGAGTVIPVFSLRSTQSFGIGDLHDLRLLIDWAAKTHQCLIQVLPMNDTTSTHTLTDSYPYSAISIYALHPIYISLSDLGMLKNTKQDFIYRNRQSKLNAHDTVCYDSVLKYKMQFCRLYYEQEKDKILNNKTFQTFCRTNKSWLEPYALFCYYRNKNKTADFKLWSKGTVYKPQMAHDLFEKSIEVRREMLFSYFLQFVLHTQFKAVSDYAREKGVILKGDLPIGISRTSVEAWIEASYFNFDMQAGAPPDFFSTTGQTWSFPTYNWHAMEKDGYTWWKKRFRKISDYFDAFRIDHILGFFRIWEVPRDHIQGLCGHFRPALPLTIEEIEKAGFPFNLQYLKPQIHRRFLMDLFGERADEVEAMYLTPDNEDFLILKPFCNTQQKINQLFNQSNNDPLLRKADVLIRAGLLKITNEVLFVEDPYEEGKYHPRILATHTYAFQGLAEAEQNALQNIANHFFYERHNTFWKSGALKRLTPLVNCTDMLICGEDLGMIPKPVQEVMDTLHILSLELERAPKVGGLEFTDLQTAPYLSVNTTSTHDMEPLREWWKTDMQRTQRYYQSILHRVGKAPDNCTVELVEQIICNHLNASSMLTIIPLQDWFALDETMKRCEKESERINIPEDSNHTWNYRIHISLEQLLSAHDWNQKIRVMIERSGR